MLRDELVAEYEAFIEGCHAECRSSDEMDEREYAGMLIKMLGPEAADGLDDSLDSAVYEGLYALVSEAVEDMPRCPHISCKPKKAFNPKRAKSMVLSKIRSTYPPFIGVCPDCGYETVVFTSKEHEDAFGDES